MIKAVLFDLDGTLLPMDRDEFTKTYFGLLSKRFVSLGYDPRKFVDVMWVATKAMMKNDGSKTNEQVFWDTFARGFDEKPRKNIDEFDNFYQNEFDQIKLICSYNPAAAKIIETVKEKKMKVVLATNPIFPEIATKKRILWAGVKPEDFELITIYDNSNFCKPHPAYYLDVAKKIGVKPHECLMVGNDVTEDMVAKQVGMQAFLVTDCLENKQNLDISQFPHGSLKSAVEFIEKIK